MENVYTWYIRPRDGATNKAIAGLQGVSAKDFAEQLLCSDGEKRDFIKCSSHQVVQTCNNNKAAMGLKYDVFVQNGKGAIRPFIPPKSHMPRKFKRAFKRAA